MVDLRRFPARLYRSKAGNSPIIDWLRTLPKEDRPARKSISRELANGNGSSQMVSAIKGKRMANEAAAAARARARAARGRSTRKVNPRSGPSLESFLREEGIFEEAAARAVKEVLVLQIESSMAREGITKAEMARRMATSRAALDRLLDPENVSVTLVTLFRAASALGAELRIELAERPRAQRSKSARR